MKLFKGGNYTAKCGIHSYEKKLANFVFPDIKLNNRYCHNPRPQDLCQNMSLTPRNIFLVTMMIMNIQETVIKIEWQENVLIGTKFP